MLCPVQAERVNVVIELFVIYKADYSSHSGFSGLREIPQYLSCKYLHHTTVILLPRITIVSVNTTCVNR